MGHSPNEHGILGSTVNLNQTFGFLPAKVQNQMVKDNKNRPTWILQQ